MATRLVCAFLMHMASEPEIRQSLAMFKYVLNHSKDRTSIIQLCDRVFDRIIFIRNLDIKPSQYKYLLREDYDQVINTGVAYEREGQDPITLEELTKNNGRK